MLLSPNIAGRAFSFFTFGFVRFENCVRRPSVCAQQPLRELRSQTFCLCSATASRTAFADFLFVLSHRFENCVRRPSVCAQQPKPPSLCSATASRTAFADLRSVLSNRNHRVCTQRPKLLGLCSATEITEAYFSFLTSFSP